MTRDEILTRLGELVGEIQAARTAEDVPTLATLTEERDELRAVLRASAPLNVHDMRHELEGLRNHLASFPTDIAIEVALGEDSSAGMGSALGAITSRHDSSDPHSAVAWIHQRIAFLESQLGE